MFVPDGNICKKICHNTYAVNACVCVCASLPLNATQLLLLYLYNTNAVHKFCVTDHEANFNFVNWYLHGAPVLEIVSRFFLFSDGFIFVDVWSPREEVLVCIKACVNPLSIIIMHYIKACVCVCMCECMHVHVHMCESV